jgi:hypothetical protein
MWLIVDWTLFSVNSMTGAGAHDVSRVAQKIAKYTAYIGLITYLS